MCRVLTAILFATTVGAANAGPITLTDVVDPNPDHLFNGNGGANAIHAYSHNMLDDGYNAGTDVITGISLALRFADESSDGAAESVAFSFDGVSFGQQTITSGGATVSAVFSQPSLITSLADGVLNVTLENAGITTGNPDDRSDFRLLDSTLTVNVERTGFVSRSVPEPHTLAMAALAFAAGGLVWRSKAK
jgi:hypothetical protein